MKINTPGSGKKPESDPLLLGRRVALMDDEPLIYKLIMNYLESWSIRPTLVENLAEMEKIVGTDDYDLVILDINMPQVNGLDVLKRIREINAKIPVVMLTAEGYQQDLVKTALSRGANAYISKKLLQKETLRKEITKQLGEKNERKGAKGPSDPVLGGKRIAVMDDSKLMCKTLSLYLGEWGARPHFVLRSAEFDELLKEDDCDLIILDINMPEINGLDLLPKLRAKSASVPILMLTSEKYESELVQKAMKNGADGYLTKGLLQKETLRKELVRVLEKKTQA